MFNIKSELSCKGVTLGDNGDLGNFHHNKMFQSGVDADIKEAMNVAAMIHMETCLPYVQFFF